MRQTEKAFLGRLMKAVGLRQFNFTGNAPAVCIRGEGEEFFLSSFRRLRRAIPLHFFTLKFTRRR
jgi:hypothetical protein